MTYKDQDKKRAYNRQRYREIKGDKKRYEIHKEKKRILARSPKAKATKRAWRKDTNKIYLQKIREAQAGRRRPAQCEACGNRGPVQFDHCHRRNVFRGWLCGPCNKVLGMVCDDSNRLRKLIAYLERTEDVVIGPQLVLPGL